MPINELNNKKSSNIEKIGFIKRYFSRIFTVLSKDIREKLMSLNIPEKKKTSLKKELVFLTKDKQNDYIDELYRIYHHMLKGY